MDKRRLHRVSGSAGGFVGVFCLLLAAVIAEGALPVAWGADAPASMQTGIDLTPPRLSFTEGEVSFWRPGAQDWVKAQVNTPLAAGDQLYTGSPGTLELQIGVRAFVRGWVNTQLGLENRESDFLQFRITEGAAVFDLRSLPSGHTVEVDTPNAAFTIESSGYYRVNVSGDRTSFITRRDGRVTVIPAGGQAVAVTPSEEVVVEGTSNPLLVSYAAPPLDDWDTWNYARTDEILDAVSNRYVTPGMYGVSDLDRYGSWRVVPPYGPVWVPAGLPPDWAPYCTGAWMLDPLYGWTWVDTEPWGWAPFHYGRWVMVGGFWAWAPGPVIVRPVYAPALVAFFEGPFIGWVALGWGEPCLPWWGRPGFIHRPWWGGWGGPRIVNNVVISKTTVVNVRNITVYRNSGIPHAVVVIDRNHFGRGLITEKRLARPEVKGLKPSRVAPRVTVSPQNLVPTTIRGIRPPEDALRRSVVATRPPRPRVVPGFGKERIMGTTGVALPSPRLVPAPPRGETVPALPRPTFGRSGVELPRVDRVLPSPPGKPGVARKPESRLPRGTASPLTRQAPQAGPSPRPPNLSPITPPSQQPRQTESQPSPRRVPRETNRPSVLPSPQPRRAAMPPPPARPLPGEPANRMAPNRIEEQSSPRESRESAPRSREPGAPGIERKERRGR